MSGLGGAARKERSTARVVPDLWHFTCADHGYAALGAAGILRPRLHPLIPRLGPLVWMTVEPDPERDAVGLTSMFTPCDRMAYRYSVRPAPSCVPWVSLRHLAAADVRQALESYGAPETWWVSALPLAARLDRSTVERASEGGCVS